MDLHRQATTESLKTEARRIGFDLVGIAPAVSPGGFADLKEWIDRGFAGEMDYIPRRESAYEHPQSVLPAVKNIVMLAMNYRAEDPAIAEVPTGPHGPGLGDPHGRAGRVARYAWGERDYHDVLRGMLRQLADFLHAQHPGCRTRGVVDTAPLLERDFARLAGLGWFGKNTMLINRRAGSWLFLAALLTDVELEPDAPHETSHCGTCTRCLDACPTGAFPEPHVLDARRCISYLTIELRNQPIPIELREPMGEWLFGCDVCQDVCPWNRKAPLTAASALQPRAELARPDAIEILTMTAEEFERRYSNTPFARPGWQGLRRNAAVVLGNTATREDHAALDALEAALADPDDVVRDAAEWALARIRSEPETPIVAGSLRDPKPVEPCVQDKQIDVVRASASRYGVTRLP